MRLRGLFDDRAEPDTVRRIDRVMTDLQSLVPAPESGFTMDSVVDGLIKEALRETNDNVSAAARRLGVTREFLRYRLNGGKSEC